MSNQIRESEKNLFSSEPLGRQKVVKGTLVIFLPVFLLILAVATLIMFANENARMATLRGDQQHSLWIQALDLDHDVRGVSSDLLILANQNEIKSFWDDDAEMIPTIRSALNTEYLNISIYRGLYDHIRLIDENGMEVVRVNYNNGKPAAVPAEKLQNKKNRYYFSESFTLNQGEVFVSPLDLNIEHGQVEDPPKPMMRFATPVFDAKRNKKGVVILNYLAETLLEGFRTRYDPALGSQAMLLNSDGYWLDGPVPEEEWGFMFEARKEQTFAKDFPDAWETIFSQELGQFETAAGLFTFRTVYPLLAGQKAKNGLGHFPLPSPSYVGGHEFFWKAVSFVPTDALYASRSEHLRSVFAILVAVLSIVFFAAWRIANSVALRKQAENDLQSSETRLQALSSASFEAIFLSEKGICVDQNQTAEQIFGYTHAEAVGRRGTDWIVPEDRELVKTFMLSGYEKSYETIGLRKDGTSFPCEIQARMSRIGGRTIRMTALRDITHRRRTEEENQLLERQVQHAQKLESLGVLAGGIAHDFNNLLMAILGNAELAGHGLSPQSPAQAHIKKIEDVSRRAAELANQMLAYSGKGRFVVEPIDAGSLIEEMMDLLEVGISKKVVLKYNFAKQLPAFDGDATQIRQILLNLITNASEAIGKDSGVITLTTGMMECDHSYLDKANAALSPTLSEQMPEGLYIYFEVIDTGCGMSAEALEKVFDPFYTTKFTGRGLGMSAVQGIVRGHNGAIKISSEVDSGTTFRILFPANEFMAKDIAEISRSTNGDTGWLADGTVLLADDEDVVRAVGKQMLEQMGFRVIEAVNGREAVELYRKHADEIACVLLDLSMPDLDGKEAMKEIRSLHSGALVILCSGYSELEAVQHLEGDGPAGFLQKPFSLKELKGKLEEIMNGSGGGD